MVDTIKLHSVDTEVQVISGCIFNPAVYDYVQEYLSADLFTDYDCIKAYEAMQYLVSEGKLPDMMEIDTLLKKEKVSIVKFIVEGGQGAEITKQRIFFLKDLSIRRKMSALFYKGEIMTADPTITIEEVQGLLKEFDQTINAVGKAEVTKFGDTLKELMNDVLLSSSK